MPGNPSVRVLVLLLGAVAAFDWRIWSASGYLRLWDPDLTNQVLPWLDFQARQWHAGSLALWDPYLWFGQPVAGQTQPAFAYPLNRLLFALPLRDGHLAPVSLALYFTAIRCVAAVAAFSLLRSLRLSAAASGCGAFLWVAGGYMGTTAWPQWLNGACWAPLVLRYLIEGVRARPWRNGALAGLAGGIGWLSGHHQAPLLTMMAALLWIGGSLPRSLHRARALRAGGTYLVVSLLIGAVQILPAMAYGRASVRWIGEHDPVGWADAVPYRAHQRLALPPPSLSGFVLPGPQRNADPFLGMAAMGLAAAGWRRWVHRRLSAPSLFFAALGVGSLLFTLGDATPLHGLLYTAVPSLHRARWPSGALFLTSLAIAVAAAHGFDGLMRRDADGLRRFSGRLWLTAGAAVGLAVAVLTWTGHALEPRLGLSVFVSSCAGAAMLALTPGSAMRAAVALLPVLAFVELAPNASLVSAPGWDPGRSQWSAALRSNADIAAFLRSRPGPVRVEIPETIVPNWGSWHGVEMWRGYLPAIRRGLAEIAWDDPDVRRRWGLAYTVAAAETQAGQREVYRGESGLRVFENPGAFPRVWLEPAEDCGEAASVRIEGRTPDRLVADVRTACAGYLVVSETYDPGWRAQVDGATATVERRHHAMRAVAVPAGEHRVEFAYRSRVVLIGLAASAAGVLLAGVIVAAGRRR